MSNFITTAFVQQFKNSLHHLVQQNGSRLRSAVMTDSVTGEYAFFDQIGKTDATERVGRHTDSPLMNTPHARRRVSMRDFEWGDLIDNQDKVRLLTDPTSTYQQSAMKALGRSVDKVIIDAAIGTAATGKNGGTQIALPSGQKIASSATGLTITKLLSAKEILDAAETDPDEERFIAVTARQMTNLLSTTQVQSADYNTVKALAQGQLDSFLGFKFIRTELLPTVGADRQCIAWVKSGLMLALGEDMKAKIAERPDKAFSVYVYASMSIGATRMEEEKVVQIDCAIS